VQPVQLSRDHRNFKLMKKALIALVTLPLVIPVVLSGEPIEKKDLTGVWEAKISPTGVPPPPLRALSMFRGDGSFIGTLNRRVPPVPVIKAVADEMGPAYGQWVRTGDREFQLTFYAAMWNMEGVIGGFHRIQSTITLSESGDEYTAHTQADFFDANWKTLLTNTGEVKGTRLKTPDWK
jgi:hypothetical protein